MSQTLPTSLPTRSCRTAQPAAELFRGAGLRSFAFLGGVYCAFASQVAGAFEFTPVLSQTAPPVNATLQRSYGFEIGLVVVLIGGVLFAVCRSSNRR